MRSKYSEYINEVGKFGSPKSYDSWYKEYGYSLKMSGRVHGCIVDFDDKNHIYINPYDGTYSAASTDELIKLITGAMSVDYKL